MEIQRLKPQHEAERQMTPNQEIRIQKIDLWLNDLFPRMEADYHEMHRLPPNLERSNPQPPANSIK